MSNAPTPQTPRTETADRGDGESETESGARNDALSVGVLTPGRRTSGTIDHLVIEAELVADGTMLDNPAVPAEEVFEDVLNTLDSRGLEPAWIACREVEE